MACLAGVGADVAGCRLPRGGARPLFFLGGCGSCDRDGEQQNHGNQTTSGQTPALNGCHPHLPRHAEPDFSAEHRIRDRLLNNESHISVSCVTSLCDACILMPAATQFSFGGTHSYPLGGTSIYN